MGSWSIRCFIIWSFQSPICHKCLPMSLHVHLHDFKWLHHITVWVCHSLACSLLVCTYLIDWLIHSFIAISKNILKTILVAIVLHIISLNSLWIAESKSLQNFKKYCIHWQIALPKDVQIYYLTYSIYLCACWLIRCQQFYLL